jgi:hypothetical protein
MVRERELLLLMKTEKGVHIPQFFNGLLSITPGLDIFAD